MLVWLGSIWLLWLPGRLLNRLLRLSVSADPLVELAVQFGLGLAFWPILFLWSDIVGWHWSPNVARAVVLLIGLVSLLDLLWQYPQSWLNRLVRLKESAIWLISFGVIAALTILTRWLHIRYLVIPPWIDSVHHTMIVRLLLMEGALPETYAPFIPAGKFVYHWGFHSLAAWLSWLSGWQEPLQVAQLILHFGQMLNTLTPLMLYAAGRILFDSRPAGLVAAMLSGLISWFPAYYLTWGRYTHLTGLLIGCVFVMMLWQFHLRPGWETGTAVVLLGAGLFLIHIRIAFFALSLIAVLVAILAWQRAWASLGRWVLAGIVTGLLVLPWLLTLFNYTRTRPLTSPVDPSQPSWWVIQNIIQTELIWVPHNRELLSLATAGVSGLIGWGNMPPLGRVLSGVWFLILVGLFIRQWRQSGFRFLKQRVLIGSAILLAWCALTALLLNLDLLGLPLLTIAHNNAAIISLFLPICLAGGGLLSWGLERLVAPSWFKPTLIGLILVISVWGAGTMANIVNPITVLIGPADLKAMAWIEENTPADAMFAIDTRPWLGRTYAGTDGGYWLSVLTDRQSILPPGLYTMTMPRIEFQRLNMFLDVWAQPSSPDDKMLWTILKTAGITHIYLGTREGVRQPADFENRPFLELVYQDGPVHIYKITQ